MSTLSKSSISVEWVRFSFFCAFSILNSQSSVDISFCPLIKLQKKIEFYYFSAFPSSPTSLNNQGLHYNHDGRAAWRIGSTTAAELQSEWALSPSSDHILNWALWRQILIMIVLFHFKRHTSSLISTIIKAVWRDHSTFIQSFLELGIYSPNKWPDWSTPEWGAKWMLYSGRSLARIIRLWRPELNLIKGLSYFFKEISSNVAYAFTNTEPLIDFATPTLSRVIDIGGLGAKEPKELDEVWNQKGNWII